MWGLIFVILRSKNLNLKKPKTFLKEQKRVSRIPDLKVITQTFRGEEYETKWVAVGVL